LQDRQVDLTQVSAHTEAGRFLGYGFSWLFTMLLFGWGGLELDRRIGTTPVLLIVGIMVGVAGGICTMYFRSAATTEKHPLGEGVSLPRNREE